MKKKTDYRRGGFEPISAPLPKKEKDPRAVKTTAKRDLRVKGG